MERPFCDELRAEILAHLGAFPRRERAREGLVHAAVAAVVVPDDAGEACFVLTRRASRMGRHSGQWALPGGRLDAGETVEAAARRELAEEVSVPTSAASVLGLLDDYETRSGFVITPVVVWADFRGPFALSAREVAAAYRVPLAHLEREDVPKRWNIPESPRELIGVPLPELDTIVHAPTAAILFQLREVALSGRATRVADYEQPVFAWS